MRSALVTFLALAVFGGATASTLLEDLTELRKIANIDDITQTVAEYSENYAGVTEVFDYLRGNQVETTWNEVFRTPQVVELLQWLETKGINTHSLLTRFNNFDIPKFNVGVRKTRAASVNQEWEQMISEILKKYPQNEVMKFVQTKVAEGGEMAELSVHMNKMRIVFIQIGMKSNVLKVEQDLRGLGVSTEKLMQMVHGLFGFALVL